jgi:16S rRNA (guanine966-N2)-methyltransferase
MRIISGSFKRRTLKSPESDKVRPTSDRAKETLFNILSNRIEIEGISCLDLFCGTGSLGLECISRGAAMCYFVDKDTNTVSKNIELLGVTGKSKVYRSDAMAYLDKFNVKEINLVVCDPPYNYENYNGLIEKISLLKTILILEHSKYLTIKKDFVKYIFLEKRIGTVNFTFFDFN